MISHSLLETACLYHGDSESLYVLQSKTVVQNDIYLYLHANKIQELFNQGLKRLVFCFLPPILYRAKGTNGMQKLKDGFSVLFFTATSSPRFLEDTLPAKSGVNCC